MKNCQVFDSFIIVKFMTDCLKLPLFSKAIDIIVSFFYRKTLKTFVCLKQVVVKRFQTFPFLI